MVIALADLPEERATSFIAMSRLSPSTYAKERFTQPTIQRTGIYSNSHCTGLKLKISLCCAYQTMSFPTLVCQRIGQNFCKTNEMCRKFCHNLYTHF